LNVYNIIGQHPVHVFNKIVTFPSTIKMSVVLVTALMETDLSFWQLWRIYIYYGD